MQNLNLSQSQLDNLLKVAGKKMGKDPEVLRGQFERGEFDQVLGGLDPATQRKIAELAKNPKALELILGGRLGNILANYNKK